MTADDLKHLEQQIVSGFNVPATDPLLVAVQRLVDKEFTEAVDTALDASISDSARAYANGYAAGLRDLREALGRKWQEAHPPPNAKLKR